MFKFNFNIDGEKELEEENKNIINKLTENREEDEDESAIECSVLSYEDLDSLRTEVEKEIEFKRLYLTNFSDDDDKEKLEEPFIEYVDSYKLKLEENDLLSKINKTHDLVPGKYEGGLKIWELSIDLAHFIYDINKLDFDSFKSFTNDSILNEFKQIKEFFMQFSSTSTNDELEFNILELGCGHALPSLAVLKYLDENCSNSNVKVNIYLQDFNKQIIENITFENVKKYLQNESESHLDKRFKFVWGDWSKLYKDNLIPEKYFNLILTSETIYNVKNYSKLLNLFKKCLQQQKQQPYNDDANLNEADNEKMIKKLRNSPLTYDSFVLLSAKTYYFGCGGNLYEFLKVAESNDYKFNFTNNLLLNDNYPSSNINKSDENETEKNDYKFIKTSNFNSSINSNSYSSSHNIPSKEEASSSSSTSLSSNIAKQIIKLYFK